MTVFDSWCVQLKHWQALVESWSTECPLPPQLPVNPFACYESLMAGFAGGQLSAAVEQLEQPLGRDAILERDVQGLPIASGTGHQTDLLLTSGDRSSPSFLSTAFSERNRFSATGESSEQIRTEVFSKNSSASSANVENNDKQSAEINTRRGGGSWARRNFSDKVAQAGRHLVSNDEAVKSGALEQKTSVLRLGAKGTGHPARASANQRQSLESGGSTTAELPARDVEPTGTLHKSVTRFPLRMPDLRSLLLNEPRPAMSESVSDRLGAQPASSTDGFDNRFGNNTELLPPGLAPIDHPAYQVHTPPFFQSVGSKPSSAIDDREAAFRPIQTFPTESVFQVSESAEIEAPISDDSVSMCAGIQDRKLLLGNSDIDTLYDALLEKLRQEYRRTYGVGGS